MTRSPREVEKRLGRIAQRLLRRHGPPPAARRAGPLWADEFFGLPAVTAYRAAGEAEQRAVLAECAAALLAESWFIERGGVRFCAKMALAVEEETGRRVFALIGAEEAAHGAWLEPWVGERGGEADPFNRFVAGLVDAGEPQPLAYLLQVVLEGFGISHYAGLAADCRDAALAAVLRRMAQDEATHHAAGLAAFRASALGDADRRFLSEAAYGFLQFLRTGPQAVVSALDRAVGLDTATSLGKAFADLDAQAASAAKLSRMRRLMLQPGMEWLVDELEAKGAFVPCSATQCAALYASSR